MTEPTPLIVQRYLAEDPSAFALIVRRYQDLVFRLCFRMLGHRQDAEDAMQETFTRVARHIGGWDIDRPIEPWLMTIAGNRCRTLLSRRKPLLPLLDASEPASHVAEQEHHAKVLDEELQLALAGLRDQHRDAFLMFHQHQMSYQEIGEKMKCPVGTVKTWVHRARTDLIAKLRERDVLARNRNAV